MSRPLVAIRSVSQRFGADGAAIPGDGSGIPLGAISSNQETAQRIAEAVQAAGLQNYDLEIRFVDGTCTLRGGVDNRSQAVDAATAAAKVPGVTTVLNQMTVKGQAVSVAPGGPSATEPVAMYRPYPDAQAAQLAYQQRMQQVAQALAHQSALPRSASRRRAASASATPASSTK